MRLYEFGKQLFFTDDGGYGGGGLLWMNFLWQILYLLNTTLSPAVVSDACDSASRELLDMQREASLDSKREDEAVKIVRIQSCFMHEYSGCSITRSECLFLGRAFAQGQLISYYERLNCVRGTHYTIMIVYPLTILLDLR